MTASDVGARIAAGDLGFLDDGPLVDFVQRQRWFGAKSRKVVRGRVVDTAVLRTAPPLFVWALYETEFGAGASEVYQLLCGFRAATGRRRLGSGLEADGWTLYSGLDDPQLGLELVRSLRASRTVATTAGAIVFHAADALREGLELDTARPIGAEQSNSSVVFGERAILKAYRRLEAGVNPELELLRFLGEHGFANAPRLLGWYRYAGPRLDATLGVLQQFVSGRSDGWDFALDSLAADPEDFLVHVRRLGEVTGCMHSVLASDESDPHFRPEQLGAEGLAHLGRSVERETRAVFGALPDGNVALDSIRGRGEEVLERLRTLRSLGAFGRVIRHHGDYHLGQVLWTGDDWFVLDFEGEPVRSLPGRRRKRSPFRDVAGMLRSFAYAAETSRERGVEPPPGWEERARREFLSGYVAAADPALQPPSEETRDALLTAFELDKAVYELRYELDNRPTWVRVPVAGILRALDAPLPK